MATKASIQHLHRSATALTNEAGKLIRNGALSAAHQALVLALQSVKAADRKLHDAGGSRKVGRRARAAAGKRKTTRAATKVRQAVAPARRRKTAHRSVSAARR